MIANTTTAWSHVLIGVWLCIFIYWLGVMDHTDDGCEYPYVRVSERDEVVHNLAYRIDPGMAKAREICNPTTP